MMRPMSRDAARNRTRSLRRLTRQNIGLEPVPVITRRIDETAYRACLGGRLARSYRLRPQATAPPCLRPILDGHDGSARKHEATLGPKHREQHEHAIS
jgi:hypothetical protein